MNEEGEALPPSSVTFEALMVRIHEDLGMEVPAWLQN